MSDQLTIKVLTDVADERDRLRDLNADLLAALKALLEALHNDTEHALANDGEHRGLPAEVVEKGWATIAKAERS